MLSKAKIKFIKSLQIKKYRKAEKSFIVQGAKSVRELLKSNFETHLLLGTAEFLSTVKPSSHIEVIEVREKDLEALGEFQSNDSCLAIAQIQPNESVEVGEAEFALVLDDIRDPGNLGTIIRTADWFGIGKIIASEETADLYSPKVISATMGSFTRVKLFYTDLHTYLKTEALPVFGTFLNGRAIHEVNFGKGGLILIGNESRGVRPDLAEFVTTKVTIPRIGNAESLNASIAAGILCYAVSRSQR